MRDVGTPRYSAPEVLRGDLLGVTQMQMADIYSYGLVLYELYGEEEPFDGLNVHQLRTHVGFGSKIPNMDSIEGSCDHRVTELMRDCWQRDPAKRPPVTRIRDELKAIPFSGKNGVLVKM